VDIILLFVLGAVVGSFLNVCISRLPKEESIIFPPSHCPHCRQRIKIVDLIPLVSFIILRGKCRGCRKPISFRYFLVEALSGLMFVMCYLFYNDTASIVYAILFSAVLIIILFSDLETQIIPDETIIAGIVLGTVYALIIRDWLGALAGGLIGLSFFLSVYVIAKWIYGKEAMGQGDIKLGLMLGINLGWPLVVPQILLTYLIGAPVALALLLFKVKKIHDAVPFGPFMVIAAWIIILFGSQIINYYISWLW
jgi:leader peptidase (prepilin peptidase) / N-methyltransferase